LDGIATLLVNLNLDLIDGDLGLLKNGQWVIIDGKEKEAKQKIKNSLGFCSLGLT
jgi:hypothetical protein